MRAKGRGTRTSLRLLAVVSAVIVASWATAPAAFAHGGDESQEGYVLVQQALAHLAHDTGHVGVMDAMEKIDDALAAEDHDGVDVAQLERAKTVLDAGDVTAARTLLQGSITEAVNDLPPAVGEETGTRVVATPLRGRGAPTGSDWLLLAVSGLVVLGGLALAVRFRPPDNMRALRRELAAPAPGLPDAAAAGKATP